MSVSVQRNVDGIHIRFTGSDAFWTFKRELDLPAADIANVYVGQVAELKPALGWRTAGSYLPGVMICGHYAMKGQPGPRQLWCVYRAREVLVIETRLAKPCRVVLEVDDPRLLADQLSG